MLYIVNHLKAKTFETCNSYSFGWNFTFWGSFESLSFPLRLVIFSSFECAKGIEVNLTIKITDVQKSVKISNCIRTISLASISLRRFRKVMRKSNGDIDGFEIITRLF